MATTANHVLLRRITLTASASSVTFDSIPQTGYTDLKIVVSGRTNRALEVDGLNISFNTGGTYSGRRLYGSGSGTGSDTTYAGMPFMNAANSTANTFGNAEIYIPNYTGSNAKSFSIDGAGETNATTTYMGLGAGLWSGTAAITSVTIAPETGTSILAGSSFSLYGIADVNTTPKLAPKADGGDIIKTDGTYWYHAFLSSGSFKPQLTLSCDVLQVAGGGGGGSQLINYQEGAGGGGAGGVLYSSATLSANTTLTATIGAGGAAETSGANSQLQGLTAAVGGGRGGSVGTTAAANGGSGGGQAGYSVTTIATGTSGQGNNGGNSTGSQHGGGGGGAGGAGATGSSVGGGGAGTNTYSSMLSVVGLGVSGYIAGGGGGGGTYTGGGPTSGGTGGSGGGGNGGNGNLGNGSAATALTGSGGGGSAGGSGGFSYGGAGSAGFIIIRYPVA